MRKVINLNVIATLQPQSSSSSIISLALHTLTLPHLSWLPRCAHLKLACGCTYLRIISNSL